MSPNARAGGREDLPPLLLLLAAAFVCRGGPAGLFGLGFYLDDWSLLCDAAFHEGASPFLDGLKTHASRPFSFLAWTVPYLLFGLKAPLWHALMTALQWAASFAAYRAFRGFGVGRGAALLGAALFLALPNKDATVYWPAVSLLNTSALLLWLGSWLAHARYAAAGGTRWLVAAAVMLAASLGFYEQGFFLLPVWLLAPGADARRLKRSLLVCGAALLAFAAYKFVLLPRFLPYTKNVRASPGHAVFVYYMAARAWLDPRWLRYLAGCVAEAAMRAPLLAAAALALPWAAWAATNRDADEPGEDGPRRLVLWGAAVWLLGYLPFCFSEYAPAAYDEMNRLNQLPALGAAAALCGLASATAARRAVLAGLAAFGLLAHVEFAEIWQESYRRQLQVRRRVLEELPRWPRDKGLVIRLPEDRVARKAPVFIAKYDASGAIRLWTGDPRREAWPVVPQTRFEADAAMLYGERRAYESLLLLDMTTGLLSPLSDAAARRSLPPPGGG
ncbi:MAG: hypothetical protein SF051_09560 [Elusimicrobiota bacterium]|nr:hypothetical protein [Elusimicrobiota bacterium]